MQTALEKPENGRARSSELIHAGQVAPEAEIKHHEMRRKRKLEDDHPPTRLPAIQLLLSEKHICTRCVDLDLGGALERVAQIRDHHEATSKTELWHGIPITNVGRQYQQQPQMTNCSLCYILCASRIDSGQDHVINDDGDEIRLFRFRHNSHFLPYQRRLEDNPVLNEGTAVLLQDGGRLANLATRKIPHSFNANIAKPWLDHCKSHHARSCGSSTTSAVSGLRLLDCAKLSIEEADNSTPYVALSYVWGKSGRVGSTLQETSNQCIYTPRHPLPELDAATET